MEKEDSIKLDSDFVRTSLCWEGEMVGKECVRRKPPTCCLLFWVKEMDSKRSNSVVARNRVKSFGVVALLLGRKFNKALVLAGETTCAANIFPFVCVVFCVELVLKFKNLQCIYSIY